MANKEQEWITANGTHIPLGEGGDLQGKVGNKIEKDCETAEKVKKTIQALERIQAGEEEVTIPSLRNDLEQYGGTNDVTFMKGDGGKGVTHLIENGRGEYLADIFTTVATGKVSDFDSKDKKVVLKHDNIVAVLKLHYDGKKKTWLLTGYDENTSSKKERKAYQRAKQKPASDGQGKGYSRHLPTQTEPRSFRLCLVADSGFKKILAKSLKMSSNKSDDDLMKNTIAFDSASKRTIDKNGFMHVELSNISKESVDPYRGYEIPGYEKLGLEPDKIYMGYRKGEELAKAAQTFNGLPLLRNHYEESAEKPQREHRVGSTGTNARYNAPYLQVALSVTDAEAIRKIESGERVELSSAYYYVPVFRPGEFQGQKYDFIMTEIQGNHVALVEEGRAGSDVCVADSNKNISNNITNNKNEEIMSKKLSKDSAEEVKVISETGEDKVPCADGYEEVVELMKLHGLNPEDENCRKAFMAGIDHAKKEMKIDVIEDEKPKEEVKVVTEKEIPVAPEKKEEERKEVVEVKTPAPSPAMDANVIKRQLREEIKATQQAVREVLPLVGELDGLAYDSADQVYMETCKILGVQASRQSARDVCHAMLAKNMQQADQLAMDSKLTTNFKSRFE